MPGSRRHASRSACSSPASSRARGSRTTTPSGSAASRSSRRATAAGQASSSPTVGGPASGRGAGTRGAGRSPGTGRRGGPQLLWGGVPSRRTAPPGGPRLLDGRDDAGLRVGGVDRLAAADRGSTSLADVREPDRADQALPPLTECATRPRAAGSPVGGRLAAPRAACRSRPARCRRAGRGRRRPVAEARRDRAEGGRVDDGVARRLGDGDAGGVGAGRSADGRGAAARRGRARPAPRGARAWRGSRPCRQPGSASPVLVEGAGGHGDDARLAVGGRARCGSGGSPPGRRCTGICTSMSTTSYGGARAACTASGPSPTTSVPVAEPVEHAATATRWLTTLSSASSTRRRRPGTGSAAPGAAGLRGAERLGDASCAARPP